MATDRIDISRTSGGGLSFFQNRQPLAAAIAKTPPAHPVANSAFRTSKYGREPNCRSPYSALRLSTANSLVTGIPYFAYWRKGQIDASTSPSKRLQTSQAFSNRNRSGFELKRTTTMISQTRRISGI